ncbi:MAG: Hpt domain-containing protein, partial [Herminiimonas sp.]|nr:Hpt domain-containing protein [Herminiimonas sp.]
AEAVEVLDAIRTTLPAARNAPHDQEHLTTLRRAFHTLKGSGRMVGLTAFGEAAWSIEQVLNLRLSASRGGDATLHDLIELAHASLSSWIDELQRQGCSDRTPQALMAAAERIKADLPLEADAAEVESTVAQATTSGDPEEHMLSDADLLLFQSAGDTTTADMPDMAVVPAAPVAAGVAARAVIGFPTLHAPEVTRNDNLKQIGPIEISVALHNIYLAEADALVRQLSGDFDEWRHEMERPVSMVAVHAAHSLAGTSATVGFKPLQEIAQSLEALLQQLSRAPVRLLLAEFDTLDLVLERVRYMLQLFALGELADPEPQLVRQLEQLRTAVAARALEVPAEPVRESELEPELAPPVDEVPALAALLSRESTDDSDDASDSVDPADAAVVSRTPVVTPALGAMFAPSGMAQPQEILPLSATALKDELDADLLPVFIEEANDMLPQMGMVLRSWQQTPSDGAAPQALLRLLHTIKGSARMAGAMRLGQHMHEMESRIEQVMHGSAPSPQVMEDLLSRHDHGLQMFDALQGAPVAETAAAPGADNADATVIVTAETPATVVGPVAASTSLLSTSDAGEANTARLLSGDLSDRRRAPRTAPDAAMAGAPGVALVRVRADILDRLVNQAGEVSIARSKLETEIDTMRQSLVELTENVARLREQLREVEMQAESQIENQVANRTLSQRDNAADKQFDPLEFDRFTRLQELTRMMAESVNDVGSVHQNLARTLESASEDLAIQARLTRELQQALMSVRMVQFGSITERLYRVTRQASKEVDKRINLDIRGSTVEIDRSVLEKMAGPFEHLLRNAIVHGIESRAARVAAGKGEVGELLIEVRQDGNEVVMQFNDDGAGLDLERIRKKATQTGLLAAGAVVSDAELTDLIFHAGFSTAPEVTELAGRGIGMDVVRAEAAALGGRIAIVSAPGRGAQFTVHLPLTLAVTQVVLLTTGGRTFAVPSVLVEQVQQLKAPALAAAYAEGAITWQSQRVPMVYLASLLGESGTTAVAQQYSPLIILKSGANRIAVHVDEILGNREVVVKNVGPQLARLAGIAGATVLGSGEIVLILNPVSLAQHAALENGRGSGNAPGGAVAAAGDGASLLQASSGPRTQHVVMVVDDSLTVRRVTQRLLSREGYQVVLAKDGVDALEQLQAITPDVMLVDIEMPRMDGFDLTRNIRGDERTRHIPIIMITSRTASKHRNYAFELGVNEYLGKPFQEDVLLASVAGFVTRDSPVA